MACVYLLDVVEGMYVREGGKVTKILQYEKKKVIFF